MSKLRFLLAPDKFKGSLTGEEFCEIAAGEIAAIPTAPAIQGAYYARDHVLRTRLPMEHTFYRK